MPLSTMWLYGMIGKYYSSVDLEVTSPERMALSMDLSPKDGTMKLRSIMNTYGCCLSTIHHLSTLDFQYYEDTNLTVTIIYY